MAQKILSASEDYKELDEYLKGNGGHSFLLVCDESLQYLKIGAYFKRLKENTGIRLLKFNDFHPNPTYESIVKGVEAFRQGGCDGIIAVGGGSAMDVAKCIKLYGRSDCDGIGGAYLQQPIISNNVHFLAIPTTAGTGSEATRYAVIYYNGEKQSITHDSIIPDTVLMDSSVLETLPLYQKKATMLDALCHSIESFWSVNSTDESKMYSKNAIKLILSNMSGYLNNNNIANRNMLEAAHIAGKAINITQTTAGHAMCYKLTSLYGIAHGHAAALCVRKLWHWMLDNTNKCIDPRGETYLKSVFEELAAAMRNAYPKDSANLFSRIVDELKLEVPKASSDDYAILRSSVNPTRLKNNPVGLDESAIDCIYHEILKAE